MIEFKLIGIIIEKNTLELIGTDHKRYYYKIPIEINASKAFSLGENLILKNGQLKKPRKKKAIPGQLFLVGLDI